MSSRCMGIPRILGILRLRAHHRSYDGVHRGASLPMNNLSTNRTYLNRGDAEARRKIWSEVANLCSAESSSPMARTSQSSSASPRLRGLRPFVHSCFNLPPGRLWLRMTDSKGLDCHLSVKARNGIARATQSAPCGALCSLRRRDAYWLTGILMIFF